jgi:hypothetical protein
MGHCHQIADLGGRLDLPGKIPFVVVYCGSVKVWNAQEAAVKHGDFSAFEPSSPRKISLQRLYHRRFTVRYVALPGDRVSSPPHLADSGIREWRMIYLK